MTLLIGALTIGLILSLLALGVFISFRDLRVSRHHGRGLDHARRVGRRVLLVRGTHPFLATLAAFVAGRCAGATTGVLHTKFKINGLLAGILVMTALYSINLHIMGKSNVPLLHDATLATNAEQRWATRCSGATNR